MYTSKILTFVELPISNSYCRNETAFINLYPANHIINKSIQFSHPKESLKLNSIVVQSLFYEIFLVFLTLCNIRFLGESSFSDNEFHIFMPSIL